MFPGPQTKKVVVMRLKMSEISRVVESRLFAPILQVIPNVRAGQVDGVSSSIRKISRVGFKNPEGTFAGPRGEVATANPWLPKKAIVTVMVTTRLALVPIRSTVIGMLPT